MHKILSTRRWKGHCSVGGGVRCLSRVWTPPWLPRASKRSRFRWYSQCSSVNLAWYARHREVEGVVSTGGPQLSCEFCRRTACSTSAIQLPLTTLHTNTHRHILIVIIELNAAQTFCCKHELTRQFNVCVFPPAGAVCLLGTPTASGWDRAAALPSRRATGQSATGLKSHVVFNKMHGVLH